MSTFLLRAAGAVLLATSVAAWATTVDLALVPESDSVSMGQVIEVDLVATADPSQSVEVVEAILAWDPSYLELLGATQASAGYAWLQSGFPLNPDGLNAGVVTPWTDVPDNDGDASFVALAAPYDPAEAVPGGLIVTTFRFRALAETAGTVLEFIPTYGQSSRTRVLAPVPPGTDVTGDISSAPSIAVLPPQYSRLTLEVDAECLTEDVVEVALWMRNLPAPATGYMAFVAYDTAVLDFLPDVSYYTPAPFESHVTGMSAAEIDAVNGWINLDGFTYGPGSAADAPLAILRFAVLQQCTPSAVTFRTGPLEISTLAAGGDALLTETVDSPEFRADYTPPEIVGCEDITVGNDPGTCGAVVSWTVTASDNCGGVTLVQTGGPASGAVFPVGTTEISYTATDDCGNETACEFTVTVNDTEPPQITCPPDVAVDADAGECTATLASLGSPETADNCGVAGVDNDAPALFPVGETTVTWTVTDVNGLTATCTQKVTVTDAEDPTIACPPAVQVATDDGACQATGVDLGTPDTDDNCGVAGVTNDAPPAFDIGNTTVTWTVTDVHGNSAACTQTVTVTDAEDPTITCPADVAANTDPGACVATLILDTPVTGDNCGVASVANDTPAEFPVGSTVVTWTVTDVHGNSAACTQTVTVTDAEDPTITCPADLAVSTDPGACVATPSLETPITGDNCGVASVTNDAPAEFPVGDTLVIWTVTDVHGNTATCAQTVSVADMQDPTISCPADITTEADPGMCHATGVALGEPLASDNCGVAGVTNDAPAEFPVGDTLVTWTAIDVHGNTATCAQTVSVADTQPPSITCPADVTVSTDPGTCWATGVELGTPVAADNCGTPTVTSDAPAQFPVGTTVVTWTATDTAGLTAACTQNVTVVDSTAPVITCPADIADYPTDAGACYATNVPLGAPTVDDNCGLADVTNDAPVQFPTGTTIVTWTVTDTAGLTASCTQQVIVVDDLLPTIECPADVTDYPADPGACYATNVPLGTPTTADNCGISGLGNDAPVQFPVGTTVVTWTVTDSAGNTASCTQTVTVVDDTPPTIICPPEIAGQPTDPDACYASNLDLGVPQAADDCGVATVTNDAPALFPVGVTIVTWTVADHYGNTAECTQSVTVVDISPPDVACPADLVDYPTDPDACHATNVPLGTPTVDDNCGIAGIANDAPAQFAVGTTVVTWTVTDIHGNTAGCTQSVTVRDLTAPVLIDVPPDRSVIADVGTCTAVLDPPLTAPTASDNCGAAIVTWVRSDGAEDLAAPYPPGTTTITWTAADAGGNTAVDITLVTVAAVNELEVTVQLQPSFAAGSVTRCVTFELWNCDTAHRELVEQELMFVGGLATATLEVPCLNGPFDCITARDRLHTLRRTDAGFGISGNRYVAEFTGNPDDPDAPGDWLPGGNLDGSPWVDIVDYGMYVNAYVNDPLPGADTDCTTAGPHGDLSGDGVVNTADFSWILINFLKGDEADCCGSAARAGSDGPLAEISVAELYASGMGQLSLADLNGDGWLDSEDVAAFAGGARPRRPLSPGSPQQVGEHETSSGRVE